MCAALAVFLPHGGENGAGEDGGLRARRESGPFGQAKGPECKALKRSVRGQERKAQKV